jgi:hypothetical protein
MSSIHSVSLNVNGSRYITHNQVETVICRVTHNATNKSIVFHLNGGALDGTHQLQIDRTVRVLGFENCFVPPSSSQDKCNELILVVRAVPDVNNSRIFCRARSRDSDSDMRRIDSSESVTIIVKDPVAEEPTPTPSCSPSPSSLPPSPSSHSTPSPHTPSPVPTPAAEEPSVGTDQQRKANTVIPEGTGRWYAAALAAETVLLIAAVVLIVFLLCCLCKKSTKYHYNTEEMRPVSPPVIDSSDTKATYRTSTDLDLHTYADCDSKEPRYVETTPPQCVSDV